jgi:hypothetical protein
MVKLKNKSEFTQMADVGGEKESGGARVTGTDVWDVFEPTET